MNKAEVCVSIDETNPAEVVKPLAVIDKCLLQGICDLPPAQADECFGILQSKIEPVVTPILIEETIVSYFEKGTEKKPLHQRMLQVIQGLRAYWMEEPLELIFREFILQQNIWLNLGMDSLKERLLFDVVQNPDSLSAEAAEWVAARRQEKQERLEARLEFQELMKKHYGKKDFQFPSLPDFMEDCIKNLCDKIEVSPERKMRRLNAHLGRDLKRRHADHADSIEKAMSEATSDSLAKTPFTSNYLLAETLYDLGTISSYTNASGDVANVLPRNRGKQINDEDDQQYVAAALACRGLLTCDASMHRIATLFFEHGIWTGKSVHIPRDEIRRLDDFLQ